MQHGEELCPFKIWSKTSESPSSSLSGSTPSRPEPITDERPADTLLCSGKLKAGRTSEQAARSTAAAAPRRCDPKAASFICRDHMDRWAPRQRAQRA
eukprot:CAMPEP_0195040134 /NCGR_PEP_ID=MMETSP0326_2-20130528/80170_1 /TAXON_ID=2866 ORGANISM="Crypthecodinium cohnii, Strain Seligo" /NCGR_SAMPLE_ID=MMETSP0326_2 /ASSEMBLY_ACC=CAM_ASM_000348 /LENGTH=96 /DNA_ID=CAMNT_0040067031 /DNA_START=449 /DNA_END=739 /DNA_ORIENTATION=+